MYMRINLLPTKYSRKRTGAIYELVIMVTVLVLTVLGLATWYWLTASEIERTRAQVAQLRREVESLKQEVVKVDQFKTQALDLENKLEVIETLRERKTGPVKLLDDLATVITRVGDVWLEELSERDGVMTLDMFSLRDDKIAEFMQQLERYSEYFTRVSLVLSEARKEKELTYYRFRISCQVRYHLGEQS